MPWFTLTFQCLCHIFHLYRIDPSSRYQSIYKKQYHKQLWLKLSKLKSVLHNTRVDRYPPPPHLQKHFFQTSVLGLDILCLTPKFTSCDTSIRWFYWICLSFWNSICLLNHTLTILLNNFMSLFYNQIIICLETSYVRKTLSYFVPSFFLQMLFPITLLILPWFLSSLLKGSLKSLSVSFQFSDSYSLHLSLSLNAVKYIIFLKFFLPQFWWHCPNWLSS